MTKVNPWLKYKGKCFCGIDGCQVCCYHDDVENNQCLECDKDLTEDLAAEAEYFADMRENR